MGPRCITVDDAAAPQVESRPSEVAPVTGAGRYANELRRGLGGRRFVASIEFVTPPASETLEDGIAPGLELAERVKGDGRFQTIAVTDRVKSDDDHDVVLVALRIAEICGKTPTVHLAGKDRDRAWLQYQLRRIAEAGLENVLMITGDRLKREPRHRRVRYYDSVDMIAEGRALHPSLHIAAAVSPFKYQEEELMNQYLKMAKKEWAGADFFITQIGWDMLKYKELRAYRHRRGFRAPVIAGVMLLTLARARYIRANGIAGIIVTGELMARLEAEAATSDRGVGSAYRRLALQIVGLKRLGYAGFQLTGIHHFDKLERLMALIDVLERQLPDEATWWSAWWDVMREPEGGRPLAAPPGAFYLFPEISEPDGFGLPLDRLTLRDPAVVAPAAEYRTYRILDGVDRLVFKKGSVGARMLAPFARLVRPGSLAERGLHWLERRVKEPIVGCETCGFCRLPYTMYVCPETCPKGLSNGACGGTSGNTCEFGDRECIHNRIYRLAKAAGRLDELERQRIPQVAPAKRDTCSWTNHFRGEDPPIVRLETLARIGRRSHADQGRP